MLIGSVVIKCTDYAFDIHIENAFQYYIWERFVVAILIESKKDLYFFAGR